MPSADMITGTMANDVMSSGSISIMVIATDWFFADGWLAGVADEDVGGFTGKTRGAQCNRGS
jgi:hypothetical protein